MKYKQKFQLCMLMFINCALLLSFSENSFSQIKNEKRKITNSEYKEIKSFNGKSITKTDGSLIPTFLLEKSFKTQQFPEMKLRKTNVNSLSGLNIKGNIKEGHSVFISGKLDGIYPYQIKDEQSVKKAAQQFLLNYSKILNIDDANIIFKLKTFFTDDIGIVHTKLQQYFKEVPVFAKEIVLHFSGFNVESVNGNYLASIDVPSVIPSISEANSLSNALKDLVTKTSLRELSMYEKNILHYEKPVSELVIYTQKELKIKPTLAWHHSIRSDFINNWEYFIDAKNGKILNTYNSTASDGPVTASAIDLNGQTQTINAYQKGATFFMLDASRSMFNSGSSNIPDEPIGALQILDAKNSAGQSLFHVTSTNNTWNDKASVSAQFNGGKAYEYFKNTHNRNSLDGKGNTIRSIVNITEQNGSGLDNAFWNGELMAYGNGASAFKPLAGALDVAGHEMTHGVIQHSANLVYQFQSGAMNESMADVFGAMMDRDDWEIGEDVVKTNAFPSGALRNMQNPHNGGNSLNDNGWQPAHMNEFVQMDETQDNGGVHVNSGVLNKAFFLFATATGKDKAEKVYYRALTVYLTRSSQFIDLRLAVVKSCDDLFGANSNEGTQAKSAFDQVGINDGNGNGGGGEFPPNPGDQRLLASASSDQDPNGLYVITNPLNIQSTDIHPLSTLRAINHPSVTDDGSLGVLIANDQKPYLLSLDFNNKNESTLDQNADWYNVAISKDGNRIALISKYIDTAIYVYDAISEKLNKFHLYNPTSADGVESGNVLYSDALEWDYTGEFLVYDAYNQLKNNNGDTISYYDINFIKVWDNSKSTFSSGQVYKLFGGLQEGISIGNPSFSKLSGNVLTFDYIDNNAGTGAIYGVNFETNDVGSIFENNLIIGTPNFSIDDKIAAFNAVNDQQQIVIAGINLNADKINSTGTASALLTDAYYPVFYGTGKRILQNVPELMDSKGIEVYPVPTTEKIIVDFYANQKMNLSIELWNLLGEKILIVEKQTTVLQGSFQSEYALKNVKPGYYFLNINIDGNTTFKKIMVH